MSQQSTTPHLTAVAELEALYRTHGAGLKPGTDPKKIVNLKLSKIKTCEAALQPRLRAESARPIAENIDALTELLKADEEGNGFEPIVVFPIAGELYVLDGHCRLEAYKRAGWTSCRVRVFTGDFSEALDETTRVNAEVRLTLTSRERGENAWQRVIYETQKGSALTIRQLARVCCVPKSRVGQMVKLLRDGLPEYGVTPDQLISWPWVYVAFVLRHGPNKRDEFDRSEQVARIGRSLRAHLKRTIEHSPALFWDGLIEAFGEERAQEIHRSFCGGSTGDSAHDTFDEF